VREKEMMKRKKNKKKKHFFGMNEDAKDEESQSLDILCWSISLPLVTIICNVIILKKRTYCRKIRNSPQRGKNNVRKKKKRWAVNRKAIILCPEKNLFRRNKRLFSFIQYTPTLILRKREEGRFHKFSQSLPLSIF
jgi:hypothetical protein